MLLKLNKLSFDITIVKSSIEWERSSKRLKRRRTLIIFFRDYNVKCNSLKNSINNRWKRILDTHGNECRGSKVYRETRRTLTTLSTYRKKKARRSIHQRVRRFFSAKPGDDTGGS